jgi:CubicO group peptidase (beta-lactamase class C family)
VLIAALQAWGIACSAEWSAYKTARVDALIERFVRGSLEAQSSAYALSLVLGINGELVLAKGYGKARPGLPADEHTIYHIGSLTKQFTAAAVLSLVEHGTKAPLSGAPMTLSSPAVDFFAGADNWVSPDRPTITVQSLLTMTSALPKLIEHPPPMADPWGPIPAARMLDAMKRLSPSGRPFEYSYSNSSYFLLAQLVETVTGRESYRDYLRAAVLSKAGLQDTGFIGDYAPGAAMAVATPSWGPSTPRHRRRPAFVEPDWLKGSADMASSAHDLFVWNKALMEDSILCRSSRLLMFSDLARVGPSRYYGMGWFIEHADGWDRFSHTGDVPGFTSLNMIMKATQNGEWLSVSVLTNRDGVENLDRLAADIAEVALH